MLNVICHEVIQKINQETLVSYDLKSVISHCSWQLEGLMWPMHGVGPLSLWWLLGPASVHHAILTCLKNVCQLVSHKAIDSCPLENNIEIALGFMTLLREANTVVSIIYMSSHDSILEEVKGLQAPLRSCISKACKRYSNRE